MDPRTVRDYFKGKTILITGGTGFMGKVLLEKLLRCCPGVKAIYVMARSKRAMCPTTRMQEISKLPLFEPLLIQDPNAFSKVIPITGDLTKNNLGMRWECRDDVIDQVQIVFNLGASLRLDADLKDHVSANLMGTKRVLELAQNMKNLESFVHVSTVFCQCEPPVVEEKIFQPRVNPHAVIDLTEWLSQKENHREITEKSSSVSDFIDLSTISIKFLSPHSQMLNPVEYAFPTIKSRVGEVLGSQEDHELSDVIRESVASVTEQDCAN